MINFRRFICLSNILINERESRERAIAFIQQNFTIVKVEKPELDRNTWKIKVYVSSPQQRIFHIRINALSGKIMGF